MQTAWQSLQLSPFQGIHYGDHSAPLQIRRFTSESYEVIKRRERKKAAKRGPRNAKLKSDAQTRHSCNCRHAMLEYASSVSKWQDRASMDVVPLQHPERVPLNGRGAQTDTELQVIPASPAPTSTDLLKGQAISNTSSSASTLSLANGVAVSIDQSSEANAEHQQASIGHGTRNLPLNDAHRISVSHDDLVAMCMEFEKPAPHHEEHTLATPPQPSTNIVTRQDRTAIDYQPFTEVNLAEEHHAPDRSKVAAVTLSRAGGVVRLHLPGSWSSEQDELLVHLRNVAQLGWPNIVPYFPKMSIQTLQHRHRQLSLLCRSRKSKVTAARRAPLHERIKDMARQPTNQRRGRVIKPSKNVAAVSCPETQDHDVQRTSRRGRPIKHPFRHRLTEGYL